MRRNFSLALLALVPLTLAACGKPDLDVALSDEHSSILDTRLIGIWRIVQPKDDKAPVALSWARNREATTRSS